MRGMAVLAAACLIGAAPSDPLLTRLVAGAAAVPAAALDFDRTTLSTQVADGKTERRTVVDRWDGRAWSVISIDGKPPPPKEAAAVLKTSLNGPVPGYYRLAAILSDGAVRTTGPRGEIVYRVPHLPKGSVTMRGAAAERFAAELTVDASGPVPIVRHARYFAPEPMRIMMVAKLDRFEAHSDFRIGSRGRPELSRQTVELAGTLFGRSGTQRNEVAFAYR